MRLLDPGAIEAEIQASVDRSADGVARASLFNLVLFDHVGRPSPLSAAVDHLLGRRPARILHIQSGYQGPTEVQVSARCFPDRRNRGVCFQEVHILNGTDDRGMDPGSWSALLIRDLPVFALLADPTRQLPLQAASLADIADKAIFDSAEADSPSPWALFASLAAAAAPGRSFPALADVAWLRLLAARRAIARAFETERTRGLWSALTAVDVAGGPFSEAALLALWLAGRLGWKPTAVSRAEVCFEDLRGIAVRFSHSRSAGPRLIALTLDGGESIEISLGADALRVRQVDGSSSETAMRPPEAGPLLLQEVDAQRGDPLYREAIAAAAAVQRLA